jgi:hypothetical protein
MFNKLFEKLRDVNESQVPDWITTAIERYLQAFDAGEVEGAQGVEDATVADTIDFIVSTNPEKELTDELRSAVEKEIKSYGVERELKTDLVTAEYEDKPKLSADAREQVEIGIDLLHSKYDYNVERVIAFLKSDIVRDLSPEEWEEVEEELNQEVEVYGP